MQSVPKLVTQKFASITSEQEVTIWLGAFQKFRLVVKFSFKPPDDIPLVHEFCGEMFDKMEKENDYQNKIVFSDKPTFHLSGKASRQGNGEGCITRS